MAKRPKQRTAIVDGEKVKGLSLQRGMNQKALAKAAGVSPRTLQRAERGLRVRLDLVGNIANALQVQPSEIMLNSRGSDEDGGDELSRPGYQFIRLKRIKSARELTQMIVNIDEVIFESDVEVTFSSAHSISKMMKMIEDVRSGKANLTTTVSRALGSQWLSVEPESIEFLGRLQSSIDHLGQSDLDFDEKHTIDIFAGRFRETFGHGEPDDDSPEAIQSPTQWKFDTVERLVVRFSRQQVGSFTYEAPMGLTHDEANEIIQTLREEGHEVRDERDSDEKILRGMTEEEIEQCLADIRQPRIISRALRERFPPPFKSDALTKGRDGNDEEGTNDDE